MTVTDADDFRSSLEALQELFESIPDEAWMRHRERVQFEPDIGIYDNALLYTPDGEVPAGEVHYWATRSDGCHLVDVRERNIPPSVDLAECRLEIRNGDGVPILAGDVVDEPNETIEGVYCLKLGGGADA